MGAIASAKVRATVAVSDRDRARAFYRDTLGLTLEDENPSISSYRCGDGTILDVYQSEFAGTAKSTVASFQVSDLSVAMAELRSRGVEFQEYAGGSMTTTNGVAARGGVRGAWFQDPDGNTLGLVQIVS